MIPVSITGKLLLVWRSAYRALKKRIHWNHVTSDHEISALPKGAQGSTGRNQFRFPAIHFFLDHFLQGIVTGEGAVTTTVRQR